eukprot:4252412-Pleurochrysis_carterae.AAC.1
MASPSSHGFAPILQLPSILLKSRQCSTSSLPTGTARISTVRSGALASAAISVSRSHSGESGGRCLLAPSGYVSRTLTYVSESCFELRSSVST